MEKKYFAHERWKLDLRGDLQLFNHAIFNIPGFTSAQPTLRISNARSPRTAQLAAR